MANQKEYTPNFNDALMQECLHMLGNQGFDGILKAMGLLWNRALFLERGDYMGANPYERTEQRKTSANGYKPKTIHTRMGPLTLDVPQTRDGKFYPKSLEKGCRSEKALKVAIAEMYLQGVSTRRVTNILEQLCGLEVSSSQVSKVCQELDEMFQQWRNRALTECAYLYLDARYEKVRQGGIVVDSAVLWAVGVRADGVRTILGVSVELSEAEVHWRKFLESLLARGLHGVRLVVSDAHSGLKAALKAVMPSTPWQRCQFHIQQNAQSYCTSKAMKAELASEIRYIFNAPHKDEADRQLKKLVEKYREKSPKLAAWLEENIPQSLTIFNFPAIHHKKIRTSNVIERLSREIKKRTSIVKIFPNEASCLRLVTARLIEISEEWETSPPYLNMKQEYS